MAEPELDIRCYLVVEPLGVASGWRVVVIEEVDPVAFADSTVAYRYPKMTGAFGVSLNGIPWNGAYDQYVPHGPLVPYYFVNDLYSYVDWLVAATALLRGATKYECVTYDDEGPVTFYRTRRDEFYFTWNESEPEQRRVPLRQFATLLLREGEKLEALMAVVLAEFQRRLANPDLSKKGQQHLRSLEAMVIGQSLPKHMADLRATLDRDAGMPTLERLWADVVSLMEDFPPAVSVVEGSFKDKPVRLVHLYWDNLPSGERPYLQAFAQAAAGHSVSWQNPCGKGPWKHYLQTFSAEETTVTLVMRTARGR